MSEVITLSTTLREELVDITDAVAGVVHGSGVKSGLVSVYAQGATAAIMIQENWDDSVQQDVVNLLRQMIPRGVWLHDRQDGNGDSHLKAGLVGPSETIPVIEGRLGLFAVKARSLAGLGPRSYPVRRVCVEVRRDP